MRRAVRLLAVSVIWGACAGIVIGAINVISNRFLPLGLTRLALDVLTRSAWTYLACAVGGGILVLLIRGAGSLILRRLKSRLRNLLLEMMWLLMLAAASGPVWGWTVLHDRWFYGWGRRMMYTVFVVLVVLHIMVYFLVIRRLARNRFLDRHGRKVTSVAVVAGVAVLGLFVADQIASPEAAALRGRPNVLIVVMDTVRVDRLSCYGYPRPTTPEVDAFARQAIRFTNAYSTSCWTLPSHASLFTGLYSIQHGATQEHLHLGNRFATVMEVLRNAGYQTWGASNNPLVGSATNLIQGFQRADFVETWRPGRWQHRSDRGIHPNNAAFARFLARSDRDRPFFAFLNYIEAHRPYSPPEPFLGQFLRSGVETEAALKIGKRYWTHYYLNGPYPETVMQTLGDLYDAEVAYVDHLVGDLLKRLRGDGRFDDTLIIVTSDHGEYLGEHGLVDHVFGLYNTTVKVPLIVRLPGGQRQGETDDRIVQLLDIFPTTLDLCSVDRAAIRDQGCNLLPENAPDGVRAVFSEYYWPMQALGCFGQHNLKAHADRLVPFMHRLRAYQRDGRQLIWSSQGHHRFYDLKADPRETNNLFNNESPPAQFKTYLAQLEDAVARYGEGIVLTPEPDLQSFAPGVELTGDSETLDAIRSLGYVK